MIGSRRLTKSYELSLVSLKNLSSQLSVLSSLQLQIRQKARKIISAVLNDSQKLISRIQEQKDSILQMLKFSDYVPQPSEPFLLKDFVIQSEFSSLVPVLSLISEIFSIDTSCLIKELINFSSPSTEWASQRNSIMADAALLKENFNSEEKLKILKNKYGLDIWHPGELSCLCMSKDNQQVISGGKDGFIIVWDTIQWSIVKIIQAHTSKINSICISDFGIMFSGSSDRSFKAFSTDSFEERLKFNLKSPVCCICLTTAQNKALIGTEEGVLQIWDANEDELVTLTPPITWTSWIGFTDSIQSSILAIRVTSDDKLALSSCFNGNILVWDIIKPAFLSIFENLSYISSLILTPNNQFCISSTNEGKIFIWNLAKLEREALLTSTKSSVTCIGLTPDGKTLISGGNDSVINVWSLNTYKLLFSLMKHKDRVSAIKVLNDDCFIAADFSGTVLKWSLKNRSSIVMNGHLKAVNGIDFCIDKGILFTWGNDGAIKAHVLEEEKVVELVGHRGAIEFVVINKNTRLIYSAGSDGCVRVWDPLEGKQLMRVNKHFSGKPVEFIDRLKVSESGTTIFSRSSLNKSIVVYDISELSKDMEITDQSSIEIAIKRYPGNKDFLRSVKV